MGEEGGAIVALFSLGTCHTSRSESTYNIG